MSLADELPSPDDSQMCELVRKAALTFGGLEQLTSVLRQHVAGQSNLDSKQVEECIRHHSPLTEVLWEALNLEPLPWPSNTEYPF